MERINFTKYDKHGAYHWKQYIRGTKYKKHVDYIVDWVKEDKVLDVGAGDGLITYLLKAKGIEYNDTAVKIANDLKLDIQRGDAYHLPFDNNSYQAITMIDVIEHFEDSALALKEAHRVAPILYIATPERGMVDDPFHVEEWTRDELPVFMAKNNWLLDGEVFVNPKTKSMYAKFNRSLPNSQ